MASNSPNPQPSRSPRENKTIENSGEINFREIFRVLTHHQKLILGCTLFCFLAGVLYAFLFPKTYEAFTTVKVPQSTEATQNALREMAALSPMGDDLETYLQLAQSKIVAQYTVETLGLRSNPEFKDVNDQGLIYMLMGEVRVFDNKESNILTITADTHDPQSAMDLANAWAQNFIRVNLELSRKSAQTKYQFIDDQLQDMKSKLEGDKGNKQNYLDPSNEAESDQLVYKMLLQQDQAAKIEAKGEDPGIVVVDQATLPEMAIKPRKKLGLVLGLIIGLLLGVQSAFLLEKIQDRVKSEEDIQNETGLVPLALIPNFRIKEGKTLFSPAERFSPKHLIENREFDHSPYQESFNIFRTNLTFSQVDKKLQAISVFSANPEEGKTLVNSDLALSLSHTGKKVLLIDADLRKSSIGMIFGIKVPSNTGLPMLLAGKGKIAEMAVKSEFENLWLLPNNVIPPNPSELLGSEAMKHLIQELKKQYDYIIIDGAPILPVTDSVVLSTALDGMVLMARYNQTRRTEVNRALRLLRAVNAPLLGTILNCVDMKSSQYGYYGYGYGYGSGPTKGADDPTDTKLG